MGTMLLGYLVITVLRRLIPGSDISLLLSSYFLVFIISKIGRSFIQQTEVSVAIWEVTGEELQIFLEEEQKTLSKLFYFC